MPACGGLSPRGASRSAKRPAECAPTCDSRKAGQAEGSGDFGVALVARGRAIRFSVISLWTIIILEYSIVPVPPNSFKPRCDRNPSRSSAAVTSVEL